MQASDEWYLTADLPIPEQDRYDGYIQLENGVGMIRLLLTEFREALQELCENKQEIIIKITENQPVTIASGKLAAPFIEELAKEFMDEFPMCKVEVVAIRNDFFGERITVSGLITARDLIAQINEHGKLKRVGIPCNMLKMDEEIFLDDMTLSEVINALQVPVDIVKSSGRDLLMTMLGITE